MESVRSDRSRLGRWQEGRHLQQAHHGRGRLQLTQNVAERGLLASRQRKGQRRPPGLHQRQVVDAVRRGRASVWRSAMT